MAVVGAIAFFSALILATYFLGIMACVMALLAGQEMWRARLVQGCVMVIGYSVIALWCFLRGVWQLGLFYATAAGIEAYWVWDHWKNNRPKDRKESVTEKIVRVIAGRLKILPAGS